MPSKKGKSRQGSRGARLPAGKAKRDWCIILLDQEPLRSAAASDCAREMARIEKLRGEWRTFEKEDRPAYERWLAATFGALLSRVREIESKVREKQLLIEEIEDELDFGGARSYRGAYARVMRRRTSPEPDPMPKFGSRPSGENPRGQEEDLDDEARAERERFENEMLFEEFARMFLGLDPDRLSDQRYEKLFADFEKNVLGKGRAESPPPPPPKERPAPPPKPEAVRIKELYRLLVRRLHPDMRADSDPDVSALWHDVQDAYQKGQVERLEMLVALTDIKSNTVGESTSLFQLRSVLKELRRSWRALQSSLRAARKDPAWNFSRTTERKQIEARLRRDLERDLARKEDSLRQLEAILAQWEGAPAKSARKRPAATQTEFPY